MSASLNLTAYAADAETILMDCEAVVAAATPTLNLALLYCLKVWEHAGPDFNRERVTAAMQSVNGQKIHPDHPLTFKGEKGSRDNPGLNDNWRRACGMYALIDKKLVTFAADGSVVVDASVSTRAAFLTSTKSEKYRLKAEKEPTETALPAEKETLPESDELAAARAAQKAAEKDLDAEKTRAMLHIGKVEAECKRLNELIRAAMQAAGCVAGATDDKLLPAIERLVRERDAARETILLADALGIPTTEPAATPPARKGKGKDKHNGIDAAATTPAP